MHQYFNTPAMSGGTRSYELGRRLVAMGHDVHLVTSDTAPRSGAPRWRETVEAGIHVHWTPVAYDNRMGILARVLAFATFAHRAARRAVEIGGDVVFATSTPLTIALPGVWASRQLAVPMVLELRDVWPDVPIALGILREPLSRGAARWLERFAYRHAREIVVLAPTMSEAPLRTGFPEDRVTVIPNGCDLAEFAPDPAAAERVRRSHGWLGARPLVFYGGTFGAANGVEWLAPLAAEVARLDPEIRFAVAGGGAREEALRQAAAAVGVLDRTLFLLGRIPKQEVSAWLSAASAALSLIVDVEALTRHAVTNKFFDTIASGTAALSNHGGYQAEVAAAAGAGFVLDRYCVPDAARRLVALVHDENAVREMGAAARRLAEERFDRDLQAQSLASVLERAVRNGG